MCAFIVLEGPDASGTSKQTSMLCKKLRETNAQFLQTAEPTDSTIGKTIRNILVTKPLPSPAALQLLFTSDRAEHNETVLKPARQNGTHIICERFSLSTILYGTAAGVDPEWLTAANSGFITPDLTIITLPPFEVCKQRLQKRSNRDLLEDFSFQQKVHKLYSQVDLPNTVFVDTSNSIEGSAAQIWEHVQPLIS